MNFRFFASILHSVLACLLLIAVGCSYNPECNESTTDRKGYNSGEKWNEPFTSNFNNDSAKQELLNAYSKGERNYSKFDYVKNVSEKVYFNDVKGYFRTYCNDCHDQRGRGPFRFDTYKNIRKKAKTIREALITGTMPPWLAINDDIIYCNDQSMPDSIRNKILNWIDQGTPVGSDRPGIYSHRVASLTQLDTMQITIPAPLTHKMVSDSDVYMLTVYDPKLTRDTFVNGFEFQSDAADMVHHFTLYIDTLDIVSDTDTTWQIDHGPIDEEKFVAIEGWTKGMRDIIFSPGLAYRIPKEAKFIVETHFSGYGNKGRTEKTDLVLHVTERPELEVHWMVLKNSDFETPAEEIVAHSLSKTIDSTITVLGVFPHAHLLAREMQVFGVDPVGSTKPMVDISGWEYLLQGKFMFNEPIELEAGSSLVMNVVYDNTDENPNQPHDPPQDMRWGKTGDNEMLVLMVYYTKGAIKNQSCTARLIR